MKLAQVYGVAFLDSIPMDIDARILGDREEPMLLEKSDSKTSNAFKSVTGFIDAQC